ncbi:MAG: transketolase [Deltaproteobacteria bacterium]|nr:transketolase [Deltaproteobacteria bacterium]
MTTESIEQKSVNTIRTLSMDAVQAANSGHPGTPMAMAPVAYSLWQQVMQYDPTHPLWPNRDRFVLSIGHASMLLYSMLHLTKVKSVTEDGKISDNVSVSLESIKNFRQLHSKCPGHPEYRWTSGVETTTGPLGQGVATSVGMALAGKWLGATYNRPDFKLFDYNVYALAGDGCMMEGVSSEAASIAGHLKLSNLCVVYDNNRITIEGDTGLAFSEDVAARFLSYGWNVTRVEDANDLPALKTAFENFKNTTDRPTLIIVNSHIAFGAPNKQDTHGAHGAPLGDEEIRLTKKAYGWPEDKQFYVPDDVYTHFESGMGQRGKAVRDAWEAMFNEYRTAFPEQAQQLEIMDKNGMPADFDKYLSPFDADPKGIAGRTASGMVLNQLAKAIPWVVGGSADLAPSTMTRLTDDNMGDFSADNYAGRNLHFGVREHAMAAIMNGMALCKLRSYGSGFMVFSDYARPSIRLAALMEIPVVHVFTHDSISVGEDGPTHQPVEHMVSLRAIPGLTTFRPADANEILEMWKIVVQSKRKPVAMALSRQALPTLDRRKFAAASGVANGAYILYGENVDNPDICLFASGSEVSLCVDAAEVLEASGKTVRIVSVPSWELFLAQSAEYQTAVLTTNATVRIVVEEGATLGWTGVVKNPDAIIGVDTFGESAPMNVLHHKYGFTKENIAATASAILERKHSAY